ncbi:hypothetical protein EDD36DRAFT_415734 [Exophiala viscosa]|uniref:Uncharacterized protein n=1 Tax=Exophiala viscosa TaxID=2486360 RepID=A0AAN6IG62_9EURO|nr:hypothetical protein EDD36DRAFT_415734 [Exophiala viscosa]
MSASSPISPLLADIEILPVRNNSYFDLRAKAASSSKVSRMNPIPEELVELKPEPEDDLIRCESCEGEQQSEQVLEYVAKIREAIALQGQRVRKETLAKADEAKQQEYEQETAEVANHISGKKRESLLRVLSTKTKDGLTEIRSEGRRLSMLLSKKGEDKQDLQLKISSTIPSPTSHASDEVAEGEDVALLSTRASSSTLSLTANTECEYRPLAQTYRPRSEGGYRRVKSSFRKRIDSANSAARHVKYAAINLLSVRRKTNGWSRLD